MTRSVLVPSKVIVKENKMLKNFTWIASFCPFARDVFYSGIAFCNKKNSQILNVVLSSNFKEAMTITDLIWTQKRASIGQCFGNLKCIQIFGREWAVVETRQIHILRDRRCRKLNWLPSLLCDGDKWSEIVYCEVNNISLYLGSQGGRKISCTGTTTKEGPLSHVLLESPLLQFQQSTGATHRLTMELDHHSLFGLLCTALLIGWDLTSPPLPLAFGLIYEGAIGQPRYCRRHLFFTTGCHPSLVSLVEMEGMY
jgi:hypothetical protein